MRVGIDLSPLEHGNRTRGIGTYAENLIPALAELDRTNEYVLLRTRGRGDIFTPLFDPPYDLPPNFRIVTLNAPALGRAGALLSHQVILPLQARELGLD